MIGAIIGAIPAGLLGWLITHIYQYRASRELEKVIFKLLKGMCVKIDKTKRDLEMEIEKLGVTEGVKRDMKAETIKTLDYLQSDTAGLAQDILFKLRDYGIRNFFDIYIKRPRELSDSLLGKFYSEFLDNCGFAKQEYNEHGFTIRVWPRIKLKHEDIKERIRTIVDEFKVNGINSIEFK